jgi:VWFA-related protein
MNEIRRYNPEDATATGAVRWWLKSEGRPCSEVSVEQGVLIPPMIVSCRRGLEVRTTKLTRMINAGHLAVLGLGIALLSAQEQKPMFRAATRLVEVTVTVVDKKGNAVAGLGPADFVVLDERKPQPVALFRFDGGPAAATVAGASAATLPPGMFTNRPGTTDSAPRNVTALVLDNINTTPPQGVTARAQAMRYLRTLAPRTITAVYLMADKLYVLHDFTDDAAALRARLERIKLATPTAWEMDERQATVEAEAFVRLFPPEEQSVAIGFMRDKLRADAMADAAIRRDWMERSLAEIEALGAHLAGIPGRKSLVWIGGGFSMVAITATTPRRLDQSPMPELLETSEDKVRQVSRRLAQQGVVLYIVDAHYLEAPSDTRAQSPQTVPLRGRGNFEMLMDTKATSNDTRPAMQTMASITGGRYFYPGDVTSGVDKVVSDLQGSYTLGFYMPENPDDKWHKLKVQVKRSGLSVRHREGYLADSHLAQPVKWTEEMWRTALSNPLGSPAIPLTAACKRTPSGELAVSVFADTGALQFLPDGENLKANLEVLIADRTGEGLARASRSVVTSTVTAAQWEAARQQATRYDGIWKPTAGATTLRVIVHDVNSGRYGSLDVALNKVPRDRRN